MIPPESDDQFIDGEDFYLLTVAPIVAHHAWGWSGKTGHSFTEPSRWFSYVILPQHPKAT